MRHHSTATPGTARVRHAAGGPLRRGGRRSSGPTGAFTLIEVMLAIGILMMVLAVIYSSWLAILRSKKAADLAALQAQRARVSIQAVTDALEGVQVFQQNQPYYAFLADTSGSYAFLSVASRLPATFPGSGLFGDQSLRRVTFQVERGTNRLPQLVMRQYPLLLATNGQEEAYPIVLAPEVTDFLVEFWDARRGEWLAEWLYTNQLPAVVRFMLGLGQRKDDPSKPQTVQVQTVALTAMPVPAEMQGRGGRLPVRPGAGTNQPPANAPEAGGAPVTPPPAAGGRGVLPR